ncbi:MAG: HAMP domain-containing sensor histidine kinase [Cyclobacteriaceae bacterium]
MGFKGFKYQLAGRIVLLSITLFYFASLFYNDSFTLTKLLIATLAFTQAYFLYHFLEKSNREVIGFLESIRWDDFSHSYPDRKTDSSIDDLHKEFNKVMRKFREIRAEKEAHHQYLKTIVHHVGIGIITFQPNGEVQIINAAARKLLGIKHLKNIKQLRVVNDQLVDKLTSLRTGGRDLIKVGSDDNEIQLAVYAIELVMQGQEFKLISLQNIQSELEEKEMEAWQNLIRVLTHEIMNSVTPISSLAGTMESEMEQWLQDGKDVNSITNDSIEDFHTALHTIHRRSDSLIKFVSDFRNMTHITLPSLEDVCVKELVDHVLALLKPDIEEAQVQLTCSIPTDVTITIDPQQIEQVMINLVKNAIQALAENEDEGKPKKLEVTAKARTEGGAIISIIDNGPGIDEEAVKKVFIPFFTTKKHGSGIGLSLSKQIMRNHQGSISLKSVISQGTEFILKFTH